MTARALCRRLERLEGLARYAAPKGDGGLLGRLRTDPAQVMELAGMQPDHWQQRLLRQPAERTLILCGRQMGKSSTAAALGLHTALCRPQSLVLLLSPSQRQSGELFRKLTGLYEGLGRPVRASARSALRLELANGSRVVSLPGDEATIRGFSGVGLLVIDEAARVDDGLYLAVRPMLAVSRGRLVALSTPFGKRGWFHDEWHGDNDWCRVMATADQCPRISPSFLAEERRAMGERFFEQEYLCSFVACVGAVFAHDDIQAMISDDVKPFEFG